MLTPEETPHEHDRIGQLIDQHFGYECHDDADGVLSTLTDDIEHDVVGFPGRPAARHHQLVTCSRWAALTPPGKSLSRSAISDVVTFHHSRQIPGRVNDERGTGHDHHGRSPAPPGRL